MTPSEQMSEDERLPPHLPRRLAAMFYDGLLVLALWFVVSAVLTAVTGGQLTQSSRPLWMLWAHRIGLLVTTWLFFAWFWTHGGQTLGMRAWQLKIVNRRGGAVTWGQSAQRFAAAGLSLALLGLGYLWVLFDRDRQAWHDRLSDTRLVVVPKPK